MSEPRCSDDGSVIIDSDGQAIAVVFAGMEDRARELTAAQSRVAELEQELADAQSSIRSERKEYRGTVEHWKEFHNSLCIALGLRFRETSSTLEETRKLTADNARLRELLRECLPHLPKMQLDFGEYGGLCGNVETYKKVVKELGQ